MWFNRKSTDARIDALDEQFTKLKRLVEARELDWEEMRVRCKRLLDRTEKAYRMIGDQESQTARGATAPSQALTAAAAPASSRVERIRQQMRAAGKEVPDGLLPG